jgi:hypothetical protein
VPRQAVSLAHRRLALAAARRNNNSKKNQLSPKKADPASRIRSLFVLEKYSP